MSSQNPPQSRPLLRLFPVLLVNLIAFGVAIPVVPALAKQLGAAGTEVGLLFALQALGQLCTAPLWGKLSDRVGRRPVLIATIGAAAFADLFTSLCTTLPALFAARLFAGLVAGVVATSSAYVSDSTTPDRRSSGMAIIGICFGLGFTIGPGIGALASHFSPDDLGPLGRGFPFVVAACLNLAAALAAALVLAEPSGSVADRRARRLERRPQNVRALLARPDLRAMSGLILCYALSVTILESIFFLYANDRYGFDERQVGLIFAGMGLLGATVQGGGIRKISATLGDPLMTLVGGALLSLGLLVATAWEVLGFLVAMLAISAVGRALIQPGALSLFSQTAATPEETGQVMGLQQSAQSLGRIIGPAIGGFAFDWLDPRAPFVLAGAIIGLAALIWWRKFGASAARAQTPRDRTTGGGDVV
jgi:predicted MFS family arabinose efflux permease